jgi:hypothetical protein
VSYVGSGERPFVEGAAILKGKHLMECGLISRTENEFRVLGLCLQSSQLEGKPHEINITIKSSSTAAKNISGTCTCKAGSGKCKHFVAVLLFLNR